MAEHRRYVPILKTKDGEFGAVRVLSDAAHRRLTPLYEVVPIEEDPTTKQAKRTAAQHVEKLVKALATAGARTSRAFVDLGLLDDDAIIQNLLPQARTSQLQIVPVVRVDQRTSLWDTTFDAIELDGRGVCLRLQGDALDVERLDDTIATTLRRLGLAPDAVDLLLDFQEVSAVRMARDVAHAVALLEALPHIERWRSLTWAGTAFPETLSAFPGGTDGAIVRTEWKLWLEIVRRADRLVRVPAFGDYAIAHPSLVSFNPKKMTLSASVRYTTLEGWRIFKGLNLKTHGSSQFNALSKRLTSDECYMGAQTSWGDRFIQRCAMGGPSGNPTQWRKVGTSHHLEVVTQQLANLPALSAVA